MRLALCEQCNAVLVAGDGPPVYGTCALCNEVIQIQAEKSRWDMRRRKRNRPAQTPEQLERAGDPFARLIKG